MKSSGWSTWQGYIIIFKKSTLSVIFKLTNNVKHIGRGLMVTFKKITLTVKWFMFFIYKWSFYLIQEVHLDVYFAMKHATALSAHDYVERRMIPPSITLTGLVIPHDSYFSHLNPSWCWTEE